MTHEKEQILAAIDKEKDLIRNVADQIWEYAELSLREFKSADLYCQVLADQGFTVERETAGIETAFTASIGSGRPKIGFLAEYDALSGLSQKAGMTCKEEIDRGGNGHGCGHNLLGAGAMAALLGIRSWVEEHPGCGTVILFGCPGEEGGAAKAFMARDGLWYDLDAALTWHPDDKNEVVTGSTNSCIQVQYQFHGIASHASGAPDKGRSALDAVELMNIGVQFLREHMTDDARIHYAITNAGGISPNVVQSEASVLYMVRANHVRDAIILQGRVDRIAEGAALMTDTTYDRKFIDGLSDTISNHTLERVLYENFQQIGVPTHDADELTFADELAQTYSGNSNTSVSLGLNGQIQVSHAMSSSLEPLFVGDIFRPGSTDVGDVSWECPTAQIHVASWPKGCPGHSWQNVSCGRTSIGHKAALHAGKVLAMTALDLLEQPELLLAAKEEWSLKTASGFESPIPKDAVPVVPD